MNMGRIAQIDHRCGPAEIDLETHGPPSQGGNAGSNPVGATPQETPAQQGFQRDWRDRPQVSWDTPGTCQTQRVGNMCTPRYGSGGVRNLPMCRSAPPVALLAAGACYEGGDYVGGVPIEISSRSVVAHRRSRVGV